MICSCCNEFFEKGTGHACLCTECDVIHPFCNECYKDAKRRGKIKDTDYKITDRSPEMDKRLV